MHDLILQKLAKIEQAEDIRILHAVESGSRAWGFPSPDSDYDVRFLYVRRPEYYLKLEKTRDVIELPINDMLDINGWDLQKALRLLHGSNPTLFEWLTSPIVYRKTDFLDRNLRMMDGYFSPKAALHHYLSTARGNYREYLKGDMVRAKKYFYVLRPILACRWVLERQTRPPMLFRDLMESYLDEEMKPIVEHLLDLKMNSPEVKLIPKITELNQYLDRSIGEAEALIAAYPGKPAPEWDALNAIFLEELALWDR
jgi:predicted nucleotidyltransferase